MQLYFIMDYKYKYIFAVSILRACATGQNSTVTKSKVNRYFIFIGIYLSD